MADKDNTTFQDFEDTLSFCDLPIHDDDDAVSTSHLQNPIIPSDHLELFEFFTDLNNSKQVQNDGVLFRRKFIPYEVEDADDDLNEYQKRDYFSVRSSSFHKSRDNQIIDNSESFSRNPRSSSLRLVKSPAVPKVNLSSITTMSAKSKRRMFMFGPVKFKPEMELSAIKKRQGIRSPAPMFPVTAALGGVEVVSGGGGSIAKGHGGHWGSLRCRSHFVTILAKSFGCIPISVV